MNDKDRAALKMVLADAEKSTRVTDAEVEAFVRLDIAISFRIVSSERNPLPQLLVGDVLRHIGDTRERLERKRQMGIVPSALLGFIDAQAQSAEDHPGFDVPPGIDPN